MKLTGWYHGTYIKVLSLSLQQIPLLNDNLKGTCKKKLQYFPRTFGQIFKFRCLKIFDFPVLKKLRKIGRISIGTQSIFYHSFLADLMNLR